jgi:hypothetical protein
MYFFHNLKNYVLKRLARERRTQEIKMRTMMTMKTSLQEKVASQKGFE